VTKDDTVHEVLPDRLMMYVNQAHNTNPAQMLLEKNYAFIILVFQDNTSKNQDFVMTSSAPMSIVQLQDFSGHEKWKVKFQDYSGPVGTLH